MRARAQLESSIGQKTLHRTVAERENIGLFQGFGVPAQIVEAQPERVARKSRSDGHGQFDK